MTLEKDTLEPRINSNQVMYVCYQIDEVFMKNEHYFCLRAMATVRFSSQKLRVNGVRQYTQVTYQEF